MSALSTLARGEIRAHGITIAAYIRYWEGPAGNGKWRGDSCGCPDDRCIGYHHDPQDECGCLPVTIADVTRDLGTAEPHASP